MTDSVIIKALECCNGDFDSCVECPLNKVVSQKLKCWELEKNALELILRLQAEVKMLEQEICDLKDDLDELGGEDNRNN